jgi:hypothetical protein
MFRLGIIFSLFLAMNSALAETPESVLATLKSDAAVTAGFAGFSGVAHLVIQTILRIKASMPKLTR